MPTELIGPFSVSDGDVTTHDISQSDRQITVNSAQIRWRGVDDTRTVSPSPSNNGYLDSSTVYWGEGPHQTGEILFPSTPSDGTFENHTIQVTVNSNDSSPADFNWQIYNSWTDDSPDAGETGYTSSFGSETVYEEELQTYRGDGGSVELSVDLAEYLGYNPDIQWVLTLQTQYTTDKTFQTTDPFVGRDVDGSYTGTLDDGEWSSWQELSGLEHGSNEFYHNISGSREAAVEFEYTWEYSYPNPVYGTIGVWDESSGVWRECVVADPSDLKLEYNHVTIYNAKTGNWGALDVVDPSDPDAIEAFQFYDANAGWLALREYQTTTP